MLSPQQIAVVIPCLNEAPTIANLVAAVRKTMPTVYVVDDGSIDTTALNAQSAGAKVLRHATPQGKGMALARGWQCARENGFEWALSMDGDGQHAADDIRHFLQANEAELVIGNRMGNADAMPWLRRCVNRWMSRKISALAGSTLPDTQCGFRLMNLRAWSEIKTNARHFQVESDVLLKFIASGKSVRFVPVQVIYKNERSKIHPVRDTIRWFQWWHAAKRDFSRGKTKFEKLETAKV